MGYWVYFSDVRVKGKRIVLTEHVVKKYHVRKNDIERLEKLAKRVGDIINSPLECFKENTAPKRYVAVKRENDRYTIVVYERNGDLYIVTMIENISVKRYNRMKRNRIKNKRWIVI